METISITVPCKRIRRWFDDMDVRSSWDKLESVTPVGGEYIGEYYDYSRGAWCGEIVVPLSHLGYEQVVVSPWGEHLVVDSKLNGFDKDGWKKR